MHTNGVLLEKLFQSLNEKDHHNMAMCYHTDAEFKDIAFKLNGRKQIHSMWHMISESDLHASFDILSVDDETGTVDLTDDYTFRDTGRPVHNVIRSEFRFRDGLIIKHNDSCDAFDWGVQALGPVKGFISWLVPATRRSKASSILEKFVNEHPEYA